MPVSKINALNLDFESFSEQGFLGEVSLTVEVSKKVKPNIVFTAFHFPEHRVNNVTSAVVDEETRCPEYKVVAVDVEKVN